MLSKSSEGLIGGEYVTPGELVRVEIEVTGRTPLMFNRLSIEELEKIGGYVSSSPKGKHKEVLDKKVEAEMKLYKHNKMNVMPAENLMACLIEAGRFVKIDGKKQLSTGKSTILSGMITLEQAFFPIESKQGWDVDFRAGRNQQGNIVALVRPRFDDWSFRLTLLVDLAQISEQLVRELFDIAGMRVGLCEFRPQKKGIYGQFLVTHWERVEKPKKARRVARKSKVA